MWAKSVQLIKARNEIISHHSYVLYIVILIMFLYGLINMQQLAVLLEYFKIKNLKKLSRDWSLQQKVRKQEIISVDIRYFKGLIPTFGLLQCVNMFKECLPKVGIKPLKYLMLTDIISCFLTFCCSDQFLLSFLKFLIFKYSSLFTFIVYLYKYIA